MSTPLVQAECLVPPDVLKISWTQLQNHIMCRQRAMLMRHHKRSPAADIRSFFHGVVADRVMREWLSQTNPQPGAMSGMVDEWIERILAEQAENGDGVVRWKYADDRAQLTVYVKTLLARLEPMLAEKVLPFDYEPEHRFRVAIHIPYLDGSLAQVYLVGGIDVLTREQHGPPAVWAGYDLKATANPDYIRKTLGQAIFYDLAVVAQFGVAPRTFEFLQPMVETAPVVSVTVTQQDRLTLLAQITQLAHDRWRGDDAPKPGAEGCSYCPVKFSCVKFNSDSAVFTPRHVRRAG